MDTVSSLSERGMFFKSLSILALDLLIDSLTEAIVMSCCWGRNKERQQQLILFSESVELRQGLNPLLNPRVV